MLCPVQRKVEAEGIDGCTQRQRLPQRNKQETLSAHLPQNAAQ